MTRNTDLDKVDAARRKRRTAELKRLKGRLGPDTREIAGLRDFISDAMKEDPQVTKNKIRSASAQAKIVECEASKADRANPLEMLALLRVALYDLRCASPHITGWRPRVLTRLEAFFAVLDAKPTNTKDAIK